MAMTRYNNIQDKWITDRKVREESQSEMERWPATVECQEFWGKRLKEAYWIIGEKNMTQLYEQ